MTGRTCLIGNSHIVCLKEAIDLDAPAELGDLTFVYSPGVNLGDMEVENGRLSAARHPMLADRMARKGSPTEVDLATFHRFVIMGVELSFGVCANIYGRFLPYERVSDERFGINGPQLISQACMEAAISAQIQASGAMRLARLLRGATSKPIYVVPQPNPLEELKALVPKTARQKRSIAKWSPLFPMPVTTEMYGVFTRLSHAAVASNGTTLVEQPPHTLSDGFTRSIYKRAKEDDVRHTNLAFGKEVLRALLDQVALNG